MAMKDFSKVHVDLNCSLTFDVVDWRTVGRFAVLLLLSSKSRLHGLQVAVVAVKAKIKTQSGKKQKSTKPPHKRS